MLPTASWCDDVRVSYEFLRFFQSLWLKRIRILPWDREKMPFDDCLPAFCHNSRSYLTGSWRRFSKSNVASVVKSLPVNFRCALVQRDLRGFHFFLNARWQRDRQKRKIYNSTPFRQATERIQTARLLCNHFERIGYRGQARWSTSNSNTFRDACSWMWVVWKRETERERDVW